MITLILGGLAIAAFITFLPAIVLIGLPILMIYLIAGGGKNLSSSKPRYREMTPRERLEFDYINGLIDYDKYLREKMRLDREEGSALPRY